MLPRVWAMTISACSPYSTSPKFNRRLASKLIANCFNSKITNWIDQFHIIIELNWTIQELLNSCYKKLNYWEPCGPLGVTHRFHCTSIDVPSLWYTLIPSRIGFLTDLLTSKQASKDVHTCLLAKISVENLLACLLVSRAGNLLVTCLLAWYICKLTS